MSSSCTTTRPSPTVASDPADTVALAKHPPLRADASREPARALAAERAVERVVRRRLDRERQRGVAGGERAKSTARRHAKTRAEDAVAVRREPRYALPAATERLLDDDRRALARPRSPPNRHAVTRRKRHEREAEGS